MARSLNQYTVQAGTIVSLGEWTKNGTGLQPKVEGETPVEGNSYSVAANNKTLIGDFAMPTLAAGEIPVKMEVFVFGKAGAALGIEVLADSLNIKIGTALQWYQSSIQSEEGFTLPQLEEFKLKSAKASGGEIRAVYCILTTETERNNSSNTLTRNVATSSSSGGVVENTGLGNVPTTSTTLIYVTAAGGHGATSITDAQGNTYNLDGEASEGAAVTVQVWSCNAAKELKAGEALVLHGLPVSAAVNLAVINTQTLMVSTSRVDVSATGGAAAATVLELETASTRLQGDFGAVHYGIDQEASSIVTGSTWLASTVGNPKQAGLTMFPGVINKPAEGAAITVKGTINVSGNIAGLVIAYKVLANEGSESGPSVVRSGVRVTASGVKTASGSIIVRAGTVTAGTGAKATSGTAAMRLGASATAKGTKTASVASSVSGAVRSSSVSAKGATGASIRRGASRTVASGVKAAAGSASASVGTGSRASGAKAAVGVFVAHAAAAGGVTGRKLATGVSIVRAAVRSLLGQSRAPEPEVQIPTRAHIAANATRSAVRPARSIVRVVKHATRVKIDG